MPQSLSTGHLKEKPTYRVQCLYSLFVHDFNGIFLVTDMYLSSSFRTQGEYSRILLSTFSRCFNVGIRVIPLYLGSQHVGDKYFATNQYRKI
jgi:hypothetical protein